MPVVFTFAVGAFVSALNDFNCDGLGVDFEVTSEEGDLIELFGAITGTLTPQEAYATRVLVLNDSLVWHNSLRLPESDQGRGFGAKFERHSVGVYQTFGFERINVKAEEIGAYVWQTRGYRLIGDEARRRSSSLAIWDEGGRSRADNALGLGVARQADFDLLESEFELLRASGRQALEPVEIATFGVGHKITVGRFPRWLGKEVLIDSTWIGFKDI